MEEEDIIIDSQFFSNDNNGKDNGYNSEDSQSQPDSDCPPNMDGMQARRYLSELIMTCQEIEDQHFKQIEENTLKQQLKANKSLFETQFSGSFCDNSENRGPESNHTSPDANTTQDEKSQSQVTHDRIAKAKPGDLLLLYNHTKLCTTLMRRKVDKLDSESSPLNLKLCLETMKKIIREPTEGEEHIQDNLKITRLILHRQKCRSFRGSVKVTTVVGALDSKELKEAKLAEAADSTSQQQQQPPKQPRKRGNRRFNPDDLVTTQQEVNENASQTAKEAAKKKEKDPSKELHGSLKKACENRNVDEMNLFEYSVEENSAQKTLNNLFRVAFGVRDGLVALKGQKDSLNLTIAPTETKESNTKNVKKRRQHVVSFNSTQLKKMMELSIKDGN